jgi:hypothetical protein
MSLARKRQPGAFKLILWLWQGRLIMFFVYFETLLGSETLCGRTVERLTDVYGKEWQAKLTNREIRWQDHEILQ